MRSNALMALACHRATAASAPTWMRVVALVATVSFFAAPAAYGLEPGAQREAQPSSAPPAELPSSAQEPPIPDPPRFLSEVAGTIKDVAGDVFFWGQSGTVTGEILNNAFLGGQILTIDGGTIGGDAFAFGQSVVIDGVIKNNLYAFASELRISEDAVIHGNVIVFAGSLRVAGRIRGKLMGSAGIAVLDGEIGSVNIETGNLSVTEGAHILGDLEYRCDDNADIAEGAVIGGEVLWNPPESGDKEDEEEETPSARFSAIRLAWKAWGYLSNLVVGLVFLLLGGRGARLPALCLREQPAPGLGFGFIVAVVFPVASFIAIVLIVSLPLGVIGFVLFGLTVFMARLVSAQFVGEWLLRRAQRAPSEYLALALGLLVLYVLAMIPYVGFLVRVAAVVFGIGGIYLALRRSGFPSTSAAPAAELADTV